MAIYSKSNFGSIKGKVGEAVGSKWRGKKVMRSLPDKRKKGNSPLQLITLAKMHLAIKQLSPIKEVIRLGYRDQKLAGISGYNAAVKAFINQSIIGEYPDFDVDYASMQLSKGSLGPLMYITVTFNDPGFSLAWEVDDINDLNTFSEDRVIVVLYNQTTNLYKVYNNALRGDGSITINRRLKPGEVTHAWLFCVNQGRILTSPTVYAGTLEQALIES